MFRNKSGKVDEANFNTQTNPFVFKRNTQELLLQREKERYNKWARKEASHLDAFTAGRIDDSNAAVDLKIAHLKGKLERRNNSMKSQSQIDKYDDTEVSGIMALAHR
jgi:hypothetical protein